MGNIHEQKCPNCGGALRYDPEKEKLVCDYCDSEFDIEEQSEKVEKPFSKKKKMRGFDFNSLMNKVTKPDSENLPIYVCESCGAEVIATSEAVALSCPYCRNNIVLTDKVSGAMRPDGIIPFKITPDVLPGAMKDFYKGMPFLPKDFFGQNKMGKVTGIYVPFWVFSGTASGTVTYTGEKYAGSSRAGDYVNEKYDMYRLDRSVSLEFKDVPVDASEKMDDDLMDSIEPFDMSEVKPFDYSYLAGYAADRFDVPAGNIAARAEKRMCNTAGEMARSQIGGHYSNLAFESSNLNAKLDAKYILMPVYQFDLEFKDEKYNFVVNGQTGKVIGRLPYDKKKKIKYFFLELLIVFAVLLIFFIVKYFIGK